MALDAHNASRGLLLAWNPRKYKPLSSFNKTYSTTFHFESEISGAQLRIPNIYVPTSDEERPVFIQEIKDSRSGPGTLASSLRLQLSASFRGVLHHYRKQFGGSV
jgi:hypothetical protein